jgi:hypothetical protein
LRKTPKIWQDYENLSRILKKEYLAIDIPIILPPIITPAISYAHRNDPKIKT